MRERSDLAHEQEVDWEYKANANLIHIERKVKEGLATISPLLYLGHSTFESLLQRGPHSK